MAAHTAAMAMRNGSAQPTSRLVEQVRRSPAPEIAIPAANSPDAEGNTRKVLREIQTPIE
jgi:hypothetical protein